MGAKRILDTDFWTDPYIVENFSVEDIYFNLYLLSNPATTQVGIYPISKVIMSFQTSYNIEKINVLIDRFQNQYQKLIYSAETQEITVLNSLKHSIVKGGKPVEDLLIKELSKVKSDHLIYKTYEHMKTFWKNSSRNFDQTVAKLFTNELQKRGLIPSPSNDKDNNTDNDNDNVNDNEESPNESSAALASHDGLDSNLISAFGVYTGNKPTQQDICWMTHWSQIFPADKIIEALITARTAKAKYPVKYATAVLENWKQSQ
ncbi:hypothetical protein [Aerococcus urinaeequi]|uniref:hypothetical protein n=1 Tax=Aerococcus urinaeequi TaxID=51665 RepID=UPI000845C4C4|nr:hypothetical protein [Aerococcus urinaeequi]